MANIDTVAAIYEAFGRGDIPAILDRVAPDVEWEYGQPSTDVPWLQPRRGREGAGEFFASLAVLEFHRFDVSALLADATGTIVVGLCQVEVSIRGTGVRFVEEDEAHLFHFNAEGLVQRFRHRVDSHQHWKAFHADNAAH
jgi:ketosteroid isomerase-like protein